jgi:drug/metabolite transporter (DMT)-like permease
MSAPKIAPRFLVELGLLSLLWGSAYLFTRSAVPEFGAIALVAVRMAIAALVLLPIVALRGQLPELIKHAPLMLFQGIAFTSLSFVLLAWSSHYLSAGLTAVMSATAPMFGALVAWLFFKDKLTGFKVLGLVLGFLGVAILVSGNLSLDASKGNLLVLLAVGAGLGSSLLWGGAANYSRHKLAQIDPLVTTCGTLATCALILGPIAYVLWPEKVPSNKAWGEAVLMGIFSSALGMLMYFRLLRNIGTLPTMSVTFLTPVVAILLGALYLNEAITSKVVLGCAVVLAGTALTAGVWPRRSAG